MTINSTSYNAEALKGQADEAYSLVQTSYDMEALKEQADQAYSLVQDSYMPEVIEEISGAISENSEIFEALKQKEVILSVRRIVSSSADCVAPEFEKRKILSSIKQCVKLSVFLDVPYALSETSDSMNDIMEYGISNKKMIAVSVNLNWLSTSVTSALKALGEVANLSRPAVLVIEKIVPPLMVIGNVFALSTAYYRLKAAYDYDWQHKKVESVKDLTDTFGVVGSRLNKESMRKIGMKVYTNPISYKPKEEHLGSFKKRMVSRSLSYKLKAVAAVVGMVSLAVLLATPLVVVPATLAVLSSMITLGATAYDAWAQRRLESEIGVEKNWLNTLALAAGMAGLIAVPSTHLRSSV